jgi:hypothetical protein
MTGPAAGRSISLRFGVTYPCPSPPVNYPKPQERMASH